LTICFIETSVFTRRVALLGCESGLKALQELLPRNPHAGATDAGTGGLRKVRMPDTGRGKGKRSGTRVHYLFLPSHDVLYLVFIYGKDDQTTLTPEQKRQLKGVEDAIRRAWP
jgi:putative transcriptional regulator